MGRIRALRQSGPVESEPQVGSERVGGDHFDCTGERVRVRRTTISAAALALLTAVGSAAVGCSPSGVAADSSPAAPAPRIGRTADTPSQALRESDGPIPKPDVPEIAKALREYVLDFEPRANPFAPPAPDLRGAREASGSVEMTAVKLMGLMNTASGSMAVIEVNGRQHVVEENTRVAVASNRELRIVEIRAYEIVVEQAERQTIVALPRP